MSYRQRKRSPPARLIWIHNQPVRSWRAVEVFLDGTRLGSNPCATPLRAGWCELRTLIGNFDSVTSALAAITSQWPADRWVVSDGPGAVTFRDGLNGNVDTLRPPVVREISATGSGDVLFASLLCSLFLERTTLQDALNVALPRAAANAAHPGVAEFPEPAKLSD